MYPGVRSPLLLPTDYIRKYSSIYIYIACLHVVLRLWLCSKLVSDVTALAPMWTDQRLYALRMGGHVLSRNFRYYIPDFSGQDTVQTPVIVR